MKAGREERVMVIGAGIAGLTAAFHLRQRGFTVVVLDRADHVGGRMSTVVRDGFTIDTAASILPSAYRQLRRLIRDVGLASEFQPTSDSLGFLRDGRVHPVRGHAKGDLARTGLVGLRSKWAAAKMVLDTYRNRQSLDWVDLSEPHPLDAEDVLSYALRRSNLEVSDHLIRPLSYLFFLAPAEELSAVNLHFLFDVLVGTSMFNAPGGVQTLPNRLAELVGVELRAEVTSVEQRTDGARVTWRRADEPEHVEDVAGVVIALPATATLSVFDQATLEQRAFLSTVRYSRALVVTLALDRPPREPSMLLVVPECAHPNVAGVIMEHNKAPGRVPPGQGMITLYWQRSWTNRHWGSHDDQVAACALEQAANVLPGVDDDVQWVSTTRWDPAVVTVPVGGFRALSGFLRSLDPASRVQFAGDYFAPSTTETSSRSGQRAAEALSAAISNAGQPASRRNP